MWKAVTNDNKEIFQFFNGVEKTIKDLNMENLNSFAIIDTQQSLVRTDLATGDFNFNNLDLTQLEKMSGGEKLELVYDSRAQRFKLSEQSLELLNSLVLKGERATYLGFDKTGQFNICGIPFYMGMTIDGKEIKFLGEEKKEIIQTNEAYTDFIGSKLEGNPYKRVDAVNAYNIGYNTSYTAQDSLEFSLSLVLHYNVIRKSVTLNSMLTANKLIQGTLAVVYGDKQSNLEVTLYKDEPANLSRLITLV